MRLLTLLPLAIVLSGCVAPKIYQWGGYDQALYSAYKDPTKAETMRVELEKHITAMEQGRQQVAPGLYAELGTLYLQTGAPEKARDFYSKERDAWPESNGLMTAMIQNIDRRQQKRKEALK